MCVYLSQWLLCLFEKHKCFCWPRSHEVKHMRNNETFKVKQQQREFKRPYWDYSHNQCEGILHLYIYICLSGVAVITVVFNVGICFLTFTLTVVMMVLCLNSLCLVVLCPAWLWMTAEAFKCCTGPAACAPKCQTCPWILQDGSSKALTRPPQQISYYRFTDDSDVLHEKCSRWTWPGRNWDSAGHADTTLR